MDLADVERGLAHAGPPGWKARLRLDYERRAGKTVLAHREHEGPLRVQRDLYPEGPATCHTIVLHPPGGVAGGDRLELDVTVGAGGAALLTTPGAGKWYRCAKERPSAQRLGFRVRAGASLEWLPQETIVFDAAHAHMETAVDLDAGASYVGWEILCLGRQAAHERFASGSLRLATEIRREGVPLWIERGHLAGGSRLLDSPVGLDAKTVTATLIAAGPEVSAQTLALCRAVDAGANARAGITRLPGVLIARWLGDSGEDARSHFLKLWGLLRPALRGAPAHAPRIWAT
jgi:urease accessory protein